MKQPFISKAIRAEIRRAARAGRDINRDELKRETGLTGRDGQRRFERLVSDEYRNLGASPFVRGGGAGGARGQGNGPTPRTPDPFAPPEKKAAR